MSPSPTARPESYDLVVGADGVHSTIRSLALRHPASPPRGAGLVAVRHRRLPGARRLDGAARGGRTFLIVALGRGRVYCYADVGTSDSGVVEDAGWRDRFAEFADPVPRLLARASGAYFAPIEEVVPPVWRADRVVLVATPPMRAPRTWRRARRWPSRTLSCSPRRSPPPTPSGRRSPAMRSAGSPA